MYGIKIDLRKKHLIKDPVILELIDCNEIWVDKTEGNYTTRDKALEFSKEEYAAEAITEEYEMVSKLNNKK